MNIYRIWGMILRYGILNIRSVFRITDFFYWPVLDFFVWGLVGRWAQASSGSGLSQALIIAIVLWHIAMRPIMEISFDILEEIWSHNVFNLCTTSVTLPEVMVALMILGLIKGIVLLLVSSVFIWFIFGINIFIVGWYLIPFIALLMLFGWAAGFFSISFVVRWGQSVEAVTWTLPWLLATISAVFVPVSILPPAVAKIAYLSPITYVFEAMRSLILYESFPASYLWISAGLGFMYLAIALSFFTYMLNKSRARGLARL